MDRATRGDDSKIIDIDSYVFVYSLWFDDLLFGGAELEEGVLWLYFPGFDSVLYGAHKVILRSVPCGSGCSVVCVCARTFKHTSCLITHSHKGGSSISGTLFVPLSMIRVRIRRLGGQSLRHVHRAGLYCPLASIFYGPIGGVLTLFLSRVLFHIIGRARPSSHLFRCLFRSVRLLRLSSGKITGFRLIFLLQLLRCLKVCPGIRSCITNSYFSVLGNIFISHVPVRHRCLGQRRDIIFTQLLGVDFRGVSLCSFSQRSHIDIVGHVLRCCHLRLPSFPRVGSLSIVRDLFS